MVEQEEAGFKKELLSSGQLKLQRPSRVQLTLSSKAEPEKA